VGDVDGPVPGIRRSRQPGGLQSFSSGTRYGASGPVDTRPYVSNPGYVTPPASVTYFFTARDAYKTADLWQTDLALNWSHGIRLKTQVFFRGTVLNLFNRNELTNFFATCGTGGCINTTVQTEQQQYRAHAVQSVYRNVGRGGQLAQGSEFRATDQPLCLPDAEKVSVFNRREVLIHTQ
jgi:hypothetical protein